jgi:hypothetical protein
MTSYKIAKMVSELSFEEWSIIDAKTPEAAIEQFCSGRDDMKAGDEIAWVRCGASELNVRIAKVTSLD